MKKTRTLTLSLSRTTIRNLVDASRVAGGISALQGSCHTVDHCIGNTSGGVLCTISDATDCKTGIQTQCAC